MKYIKFCPMCGTEFLASRISAAYCSKKCCNKAARIPPDILEIALINASTRQRPLASYNKATRELIQSNTKVIQSKVSAKGLGFSSLTKKDEATLIADALKIKRDREIKQFESQLKEEDHSIIVDEEMMSFNLDDIDKEIEEQQENNNGNQQNNNGNSPRSGIRRIGG